MRRPLPDILEAAAALAQHERQGVNVPVVLLREVVESLRDLEAIALAGEGWARHVAIHGRLAPFPLSLSIVVPPINPPPEAA